jgi:peptide deformylase
MAIHKIVFLPDPCLRAPCARVEEFNDELQQLIDDMFDTMYSARGVGLAAPQIGINLRLAVIDVTPDKSKQFVLINPELLESHGEEIYDEGCLSVPSAYDTVTRAARVKMQATDRHGKDYVLEAEGLLCEAIQHEIDHLNGKLFVDLLSPVKRERARKKLEKYKREQARK